MSPWDKQGYKQGSSKCFDIYLHQACLQKYNGIMLASIGINNLACPLLK